MLCCGIHPNASMIAQHAMWSSGPGCGFKGAMQNSGTTGQEDAGITWMFDLDAHQNKIVPS